MWNKNDIPDTKTLPQVRDWVQDMIDFETKVMEANHPTTPTFPDIETQSLRGTIIAEEINETFEAMENKDMVEIADGIVDSIVVLIGTALSYGIDIRPIWNEVHKTNMAKIGGKVREDGKKLKPEGWQPPQIKKLLEEQGYKEE